MTIHVNYETYISMNEYRMDKFYLCFIYVFVKLFLAIQKSKIQRNSYFLKRTYTKLLAQESLQCLNFQLADQLTSTMYFSSLAKI